MKQSSSIYEKIQYALNDLPGESAHIEMYPLRNTISEVKLSDEEYRVSAVSQM